LKDLKKLGLTLGIITNLNQDMDVLLNELDLQTIIDVIVTSSEVGVEKPHPSIFLRALDKVGITPQEAIHVGDQLFSDAQGAKAVGIKPVLIVRDLLVSREDDVKTIKTMGDLLDIT
jgi:putative hydrolase of the HAD superfamily